MLTQMELAQRKTHRLQHYHFHQKMEHWLIVLKLFMPDYIGQDVQVQV